MFATAVLATGILATLAPGHAQEPGHAQAPGHTQEPGHAPSPFDPSLPSVVEELRAEARRFASVTAGKPAEAEDVEAGTVATSAAAAWRREDARLDEALREHAARAATWKSRKPLGPPDLASLELPLSVLMARIDEELPKEWADRLPLWSFLDAIGKSDDPRRLRLLVELSGFWQFREDRTRGHPFARPMATAMTLEQAKRFLRARLGAALRRAEEPGEPSPTLEWSEDMPMRAVLERFAASNDFDAELRDLAWRWARLRWLDGPLFLPGEQWWDLLLRLDAERAGPAILEYWGRPEPERPEKDRRPYDGKILELLAEHARPNPEIAAAAARILTEIERGDRPGEFVKQYRITQLLVIRLKADPEGFLPRAIRIVDAITRDLRAARSNGPPADDPDVPFDERDRVNALEARASHLIRTMLETEVPQSPANAAFARFVAMAELPAILRLELLDRFAEQRRPDLEKLVAAFLRTSPPHARSWIEDRAENRWGEAGRPFRRDG